MSKLDELRAARASETKKAEKVVQSEPDKGSYVNTVLFSGHLGKVPEYVVTATGKEICKCTLAVFNPGNKDNSTMWFDLVMWLTEKTTDKGEENVEAFTRFCTMEKGQECVIEGRLSMRVWKEKAYYTISLRDIN